jgi:transposase-like protein
MSLLDQVRDLERQVVSRLRELQPLVREYEQLRQAAERLGIRYAPHSDGASGQPRQASRRRRPSQASARRASTRGGRAARTASRSRPATRQPSPRRTSASADQREQQVLQTVDEHPGSTVAEIGQRLGVAPSGLYRVVRRLTESGRLRKEGTQLHPVDSPPAAVPAPANPETTTHSSTTEASQ